eukprot:309286-Amphidinium_carterae.1
MGIAIQPWARGWGLWILRGIVLTPLRGCCGGMLPALSRPTKNIIELAVHLRWVHLHGAPCKPLLLSQSPKQFCQACAATTLLFASDPARSYTCAV